jgi:hypothetical protein
VGFKPPKKLYKLTFADEDMAGLVVTMHSIPVGSLLRLQELSDQGADQAKVTGTFREMMDMFAGALVEWNLVDEQDQILPTTLESVLGLDTDFLMTVITSWTQAISGVSAPLDAGSTSGTPFPEGSIPMEGL